MERINFFSAVLLLFLLVPASVTRAQNVSTQKGLTTAVFTVSQGTIKVYLPDDIRPGETISGSITAEPSGKNAKHAAKNLAALQQLSIRFNQAILPVNNGGKPFQVNMQPGKPVPCQLSAINESGAVIGKMFVPSIPEYPAQAYVSVCNINTHALTGAAFRISGPFDGDASNTRFTIGGRPVEVLAESPRQCIISFPALGAGLHELSCQEKGQPSCTKKVHAVDMTVTAGKVNLQKGEKTQMTVQLTGLEDLKDTALLTVTNQSASVISMTGGNSQAIPVYSSGATGNYTQQIELQSTQSGSFTVNVNLSLPEINNNPQPVYNIKAWLPLNAGDLTAHYDGQTDEAKQNGGEHVYIIDNTVRIFRNGIFLQDYELANGGSTSVQQMLTGYMDPDYPDSGIGCDSMNRQCNRDAAYNIFWGDVYSIFEGRATLKLAAGDIIEKTKQKSLLITRGWEINCCTGEFALRLFFQSMSGLGDKGTHHVIFTKLLKTGKPCPVNCLACKRKCDDDNRMIEAAKKKMEEDRIKQNN